MESLKCAADNKNDNSELSNQEHTNWFELPSIPLEIIYTYLNSPDRINMALVCKNWSKVFYSPEVWKKITYVFNDSETDTCHEIEVTKKFGFMFKYVKIDNTFTMYANISKAIEQLQIFFDAMAASKCQLLSLEFTHSLILLNKSADLINTIISFLQTQYSLKTLIFCNSGLEGAVAVKILTAVGLYSKSLRTLVLKGFVRDEKTDGPGPQQSLVVSSFLISSVLKVDYSKFFVENMKSLVKLSDSKMRSMKHVSLIEIEGECSFPSGNIPSSVWKRLSKFFPQLRVNMKLYASVNYYELPIADYIPLQHLECCFESDSGSYTFAVLLRLLCDCRALDVLTSFSIKWVASGEDISNYLIPFLKSAKKLKKLNLCLRGRVDGFDEVFEYLLQTPPESLKYIDVSVTRIVTRSIKGDLPELFKMYTPLLENNDFKVNLYTDEKDGDN